MDKSSEPRQHQENAFFSLLCNVILPVIVLQQVSRHFGVNGPLYALILALCFPIGYATWDYIRHRHKNYLSLFGCLSVCFTGGFALLHLEGPWFVLKEAAFPALMGLGVLATAFSKKPFVATLFCNDQVLNMGKIYERLNENYRLHQFDLLIKKTTYWLAASFAVSSLLNLIIAQRIFTHIDPNLSDQIRSTLLNEQIARMTGLAFLAIALPMMGLSGLVLWTFLRRLEALTGLSLDEILKK